MEGTTYTVSCTVAADPCIMPCEPTTKPVTVQKAGMQGHTGPTLQLRPTDSHTRPRAATTHIDGGAAVEPHAVLLRSEGLSWKQVVGSSNWPMTASTSS